MESGERETLWEVFLKIYEPDFKEYLGYGKEEIEKIGIDKFFEFMGWKTEEDLNSYRTDKLHAIPCVECKEEFAVFEMNYGLCDKCQKGYNLEEFAQFTNSIRSEQGEKAVTDILGAFYSSEEYRDCFKVKSNDIPEFAWISLKGKSWRLTPLQELIETLDKAKVDDVDFKYQIVLHDQSLYEKNGESAFDDIKVAQELAEIYPNIFQHKNS